MLTVLLFLLNTLLILFWPRLWIRPTDSFSFNPYVSGPMRFTDRIFAYLNPVLRLPDQLLAAVVMLIIFTLKTLIMCRIGGVQTLTIGGQFLFSPPLTQTGIMSDAAGFLMSFSDSALFFLNFWSLFFFTSLITPSEHTRAREAFHFYVQPFGKLNPALQPLLLILLYAGLLGVMTQLIPNITPAHLNEPQTAAASFSPVFTQGPLPLRAVKTVWMAILALVQGLDTVCDALFVLILGNILCALLRIRTGFLLCTEFVDMILGRFSRQGASQMGIDFTPIIFYFVVNLLYTSSSTLLARMIMAPGIFPIVN